MPAEKIRLLVVDDHTLVRDGLCRLLTVGGEVEVLGQAGTGAEAVQLCGALRPAVVLLDYNLPDMDGLESTRQILELGLLPPCRVLILTMYTSEEYAVRLIRAGASGFLAKSVPAEELMAAIRKVAAGGTYVSSCVMERLVACFGPPGDEAPEASLSDRELQVLVRLARGGATREVATALSLSISTVETYRGRLLQKLSLRTNSDLTRFAIRRGLIDLS